MLKTLVSLCTRFVEPGKWRMRIRQLLGIEIRPVWGNERFCALDDRHRTAHIVMCFVPIFVYQFLYFNEKKPLPDSLMASSARYRSARGVATSYSLNSVSALSSRHGNTRFLLLPAPESIP
jgi:hypothetical protein